MNSWNIELISNYWNGDSIIQYMQVDSLRRNHQYNEAIELADKCINEYSNIPDFYSIKAGCLSDVGQFEDALVLYQHAYEISGKLMFLINVGQTYMNLGKYMSSIQVLNQVLSKAEYEPQQVMGNKDDFYASIYYKIGLNYMSISNYNSGLENFEIALEHQRTHQIFYQIGVALYKLNSFEKAVAAFNASYRLGNVGALGMIQRIQGDNG